MFSCEFCVTFKSSFFTEHLGDCFWRCHAEFVVVSYIDYPAIMACSLKNIWRWIWLISLAATFDLIWLKCICRKSKDWNAFGFWLIKQLANFFVANYLNPFELFWREIFRQPNYKQKCACPEKFRGEITTRFAWWKSALTYNCKFCMACPEAVV